MPDFLEPSIILALILFQSIFGIGLLMFGTPTFIMLGYNFPETLALLLPISFTISSLQFFLSTKKNKLFLWNFNLFCIPFLVFFLYIALTFHQTINFKLYTSLVIIFFSIISLSKPRFVFKNNFTKIPQKIVLILIGIIHGLTNLGGSLLAIFSTLISNSNKDLSRYFISYGYMVMSLIQIIILSLFEKEYFNHKNIYYIATVFIFYFPMQKLFQRFNNIKFTKIINILALIYGLNIFINSLIN